MFLKKVLSQPNLVGSVLIALMLCVGFVHAFAFDGFNIEVATGGEVEAWLAQANGGGSGQQLQACTCTFTKKGIAALCGCPRSSSGKPCKGQTIDGCKRKKGTGCRLTTKCHRKSTDGTGKRNGCYWSICKNAVNGKHSECDRTSCPEKGKGTHPGKL